MVYRIWRSVDIHFSHHLRGHRGACIHVHGHTWKFELVLSAPQLDQEGFVVDFTELSERVLLPCHRLLDHSLAVGEATFDEVREDLAGLGIRLLGSQERVHGHTTRSPGTKLELNGAKNEYPGGMRVAVFPFSPTSERLAEWLYGLAEQAFKGQRVQVDAARIYETLHPVASVAEYARGTAAASIA